MLQKWRSIGQFRQGGSNIGPVGAHENLFHKYKVPQGEFLYRNATLTFRPNNVNNVNRETWVKKQVKMKRDHPMLRKTDPNLIVSRLRSSRIHVIDTKDDQR